MTDFGGKTSIFSHPVYLFLREFSLQDFRGGSEDGKYVDKWAIRTTAMIARELGKQNNKAA
ncbi:antirestriction Ral family protein [Escherichia coli]|uniref:antirestriction Ral family protein n=1 Tax=Escherichia coli TaxID=562 RepID=UPI001F4341E7|nr:antirestriction Ral family protein [Escherichia coli]